MKLELEQLSKIEKVKPSKDLFLKIEHRIKENKKSVFSLTWISLAAALLTAFLVTEVYLVSINFNIDGSQVELISETNNQLYDE